MKSSNSNSSSNPRPKALLAWSSGKDSAWTLNVVRRQNEYEVVGLLTTINEDYQRVAMHAVRREILEAQARAAGLPLRTVPIPVGCSDVLYEERMGREMEQAAAEGITHVIFGDLFLEDLRQWRCGQLAKVGMHAVFPLWMRDTKALAREIIAGGLVTYITCVNPQRMPAGLCGSRFDEEFLAALPAGVDHCGENGEFHSCVVGGPMFDRPLPVKAGPTVERDGFVFTDLELLK